MFKRSGISKTKGVVLATICFVAAFLLIQSNMAFGGGWNAPWKKERQATNAVRTEKQTVTNIVEGIIPSEDELTAPAITAVSTVPKLFWVDCGPQFDCTNATLRYVDPSSSTPVETLFDSGIFVTVDYGEIWPPDIENHSFLSGTLNLTTYQLTNLKTGYIFYFKGGKIWLVDTTTLVKKQLSAEAGITSTTLCEVRTFTDWQTPSNNTIQYTLKGPDGQCDTGDDIVRTVKVGMTPSTPPINLALKRIERLLLTGRYIVRNYSPYPPTVEICSSNLTTCTPIDTFNNDADAEDYDKNRVVLLIDGKIKRYNYASNTLTICYTPASNEHVDETALDKDGYIYFSTIQEVSPFTNTIKRVLCGNSPQTIISFATSAELPYLDISISPTYVVYAWPNPSNGGERVRSILKGGGTPIVIIVITDARIEGGSAGQYYFCEDTTGNVHRIKLDGTERIKRSNSQLNGPSFGGSADWHYDVNPLTLRVFLSNISNNLKSYAIDEDFRDTAKGISMGTVPVNLSNLGAADVGLDMLGVAMKRFIEGSYGSDILLLKADTPSSLKRLTNSNGFKFLFQYELH